MLQIIITGAHGFIGNNVLDKFLTLQPEELGIPKSKKPKFSDFDKGLENPFLSFLLSDLSPSFTRETAKRFCGSSRTHYVDYEDLFNHLEKQTTKPLLVIHNGACSSTTETDPAVFETLNLGYTKKLWEYCTHFQIPFIYASSAATYGDGSQGFSDRKEDCKKYVPLNLYGKSKLDFDLWALNQKETPPTWFGLRYFNVYGPFESHKGNQSSMVYHGYHQALRTGKIRLFESNSPKYKNGDQERDFVFIDDVVDITLELARLSLLRQQDPRLFPLPEKGLFLNVGCGVPETWNTLATSVSEAIGIKPNIEYIPIPDSIKNQYQNYTCADLSQLRSIGIKHPFTPLKKGVQAYIHKHLMRGQ